MSKKTTLDVREAFELSQKHTDVLHSVLDRNNKLIFIDGPAGTCKTYIAVMSALKLMQRKSFKKMLYLRSIAESSSKMFGTLPGTIDEKMAPFATPLYEKLDELLTPQITLELIQKKIIEIQPLNFLRGVTFHDTVVILDEAQNATIDQMLTVITRLGEHGKLIVIGDTKQSDIKDKTGYRNVFETFNNIESHELGIISIQFDVNDIKRSNLLRFIIEKLEANGLY